MLTKKEAEKLMKIKGEARGMVFKTDYNVILGREGKEGVKKIEDKMAKLGFPLEYEKIRPMDFYPVGLGVISRLVIKEAFNFSNKDIETWGASTIKFSIFIKIFMKFFGSLELIVNQVPKIWRRHYTIGDTEMPNFSKESKYVVLRMKNFKIHPIYCDFYKGYFAKVCEMVVKAPVASKETKCMFKGDPYHEYLLTW